jgi:hypothetical protein
MSILVGDLWPADLVKTIPISPMSIMQEQAIRLGGKTGELVQADVRPEILGNTVILKFELVMPLLENYRYKIIEVAHPVDQFFPLRMSVTGDQDARIENQAAFVQNIKDALNSDRIKNVIRTFVDMQSPHAQLPAGAN